MTQASQAQLAKPETDDELLRRIEAAESTIAVAKKNIEMAKAELLSRRQKEIQSLLKAKDEPYGDIKIIVGNRECKINVPKKVDWDQSKLATKYQEIEKDGADPDEYIDVEFSISETKYKAWPKNIKDEFVDARTVKPGNPSLKIEKVE